MIKKILQWLFKREYKEALELVKLAREQVKYVKYDVIDMGSEKFLFPIQDVVKSEVFMFWLLERKRQYDDLIKYSPIINRENNIGRAMAIDELLRDCETFKANYAEMLKVASNG